MSNDNKVKWCLNKAERESKEGKKHRGLIKKEQDIEEAEKHLKKAEHNLSAIIYFNKGGFSDWSISAGFYCIYHCFLAVAIKFGYESRNQECTISLMKYLNEQEKINLDNKFINALNNYEEQERQESNIIERREYFTYGTTISSNNEKEIAELIDLCKECLSQAKDIIFEEIKK